MKNAAIFLDLTELRKSPHHAVALNAVADVFTTLDFASRLDNQLASIKDEKSNRAAYEHALKFLRLLNNEINLEAAIGDLIATKKARKQLS